MLGKKFVAYLIIAIISLIIVGGIMLLVSSLNSSLTDKTSITPTPVLQKESGRTEIANPASQNCEDKGGEISIQTRGDGGQWGICEFENGYSCEEWALFQGDCPQGGVDTSNYESDMQKDCLLLGGELDDVNLRTCTLPNGDTCNTEELYSGTCQ